MTFEKLREEIWNLSITAGVNQRYHQAKTASLSCQDRAVRVATGFLTVASAMLSVATMFSAAPTALAWSSLAVSTAAAIAGVLVGVFPFGDTAKKHEGQFRRWSDLRIDADALDLYAFRENAIEAISYLTDRVGELKAKKNDINATEDRADMKLLEKCQKEEHRSRTG